MALASRSQVFENCPVLDSRAALIFELLKVYWAPEKLFGKRFFWWSLEKFFWRPFFFWDRLINFSDDLFLLESSCACALGLEQSCAWPRERLFSVGLSLALALASVFFVSLASSSSVARGGSSLPHWLVKYAKLHVFGGFEADFWWKIENSPPHRKTAPLKRLNFRVWPKNQSKFWWRPFFFLETTWFWIENTLSLNFGEDRFFFFGDHLILGGKNVCIPEFGQKISLNFGEDLFFFFLEITWTLEENPFEFLSFPRKFVSIFGQTDWNWFKNNENMGQGRLHFTHSFKKAPTFSKSWLRAWPQALHVVDSASANDSNCSEILWVLSLPCGV